MRHTRQDPAKVHLVGELNKQARATDRWKQDESESKNAKIIKSKDHYSPS